MFLILSVIFSIAVCAIGYRMRGGMWGPEIGWTDTPNRICSWGGGSALALTALMWSAGLVSLPYWYLAPLVLILLSYGASTVGNFNSLGMGTGDTPLWECWLGMTAKGLIMAAAFCMVLYFIHLPIYFMIAAGFLCPVCYYTSLKVTPANQSIIPLGEWLFGSLLGLSLGLSFIL